MGPGGEFIATILLSVHCDKLSSQRLLHLSTLNKETSFDRDTQLSSVKDKEQRNTQGLNKISTTHVSPQTQGSSQEMGQKRCKSHREWMPVVKQYLLDTIGRATVHEFTVSAIADTRSV